MEKALPEATKQKKEAARRRYSNEKRVICTNFKIANFVLSGDVTKPAKNWSYVGSSDTVWSLHCMIGCIDFRSQWSPTISTRVTLHA